MYLKNCIAFDTRLCIETTYVLDNSMEWDLVWTTGGAYDKSFNKVLSLKMLNEWPNNEYKYKYKKITMPDYCGQVNEYINLYRVPRTYHREYNADIFSVIFDLFAHLVISDYSLYKCVN